MRLTGNHTTKHPRTISSNRTLAAGFDLDSMIDQKMVAEAQQLRERALGLREQADHLDSFLATSYRRRASELQLEAWLLEVRSGLPESLIHTAA
ncbi:MAG: hypothetical protein F2520_01805 [Actinobacteria bacterium]|uniref:Unannotated protein n=1 Tax=freshwater metagenome TaxID=449393 RepID=A0A6J7IW38_9ZZZZ|nr:hypothetical protein [Actinomycetota bacterium]MTA76978.1 hypothetical protein [Actinomycetota bacterium]